MRDFFQRQETARHTSATLVCILVGLVACTVVATSLVLASVATLLALLHVELTTKIPFDSEYWVAVFQNRLLFAFLLSAVAIVGVTVWKTHQILERGGAELARDMGGSRVLVIDPPPEYRQLINVVEELSIATGVSPPKVFVLEKENSVNAFAAGSEPNDIVVGITRGALQQLNRSQLQGVLAHEFSHIVHGDVRISVQTLGALQGMELVASAAQFLLRTGMSGVRIGIVPAIFGSALWPIGQIGVLFGMLARMAINRQREFLADAAAVQYTRDPHGICLALQVIQSLQQRTTLESAEARLASHLFFADQGSVWGNLLSSHPPLQERIRRLDPNGEVVREHTIPNTLSPNHESGEPLAAGELSLEQQEFLATLARVRAQAKGGGYDPRVTHLPTLVVTAAAVLAAAFLFTWLTR